MSGGTANGSDYKVVPTEPSAAAGAVPDPQRETSQSALLDKKDTSPDDLHVEERRPTLAIDQRLADDTESFLRISSLAANLFLFSCTAMVMYAKFFIEKHHKGHWTCLDAYQRLSGVLIMIGCFFSFAEAPLRAFQKYLEESERLKPLLDAVGGIRQLSMTSSIVGEGFLFLAVLVFTNIPSGQFDFDVSFLTIDKVPIMAMLGYSLRSEIIHVSWTITILHLNTRDGGTASKRHLDSWLYRVFLCLGPAACLFLVVQQAANLLYGGEAEDPTRMPLPPRVYPSSVLVVWLFLYTVERTYTRSFVVHNPEGDEYSLAKNRARTFSGVAAVAIVTLSTARWLRDIMASSDYTDRLRTDELWMFMTGMILAATLREVVFGAVILISTGKLEPKDTPGFAVAALLQLLFWIGAGVLALYGKGSIYDFLIGGLGCSK